MKKQNKTSPSLPVRPVQPADLRKVTGGQGVICDYTDTALFNIGRLT